MFPLPLQQSALGNIVSFFKSVTVGSSETARTDRGYTRGSDSTAPTAQQALTRRIRRRGGCRTTLMAQRLPRRARRDCWRGMQGHKESAACTKRVVGAQPMHRVWWPQLRRHVRPQPRSPARPLPCASTTG